MDRFFQENQKLLLTLANTPEGKDLLGFSEEKDKIVKLSPNSVHFLRGFKGKKPLFQAFFKTYDFVGITLGVAVEKALIVNDEWKPVDTYKAFKHYGWHEKGYYPQIFLTTTTYSNSFTTIGLRYHNTTWATAHSGSATADGNNNWGNVSTAGNSASFDGTNYGINRFYYDYDTSALTSGATISSAFHRQHGTSTSFSNVNSESVVIVSNSVTSTTTLANSDWANIGSTSFGSLAFASWSQSGNNDITLNASGLANISKTSVSKFASTTDLDLNNTTPTGANYCTFDSWLLSVTYTLSGGAFFLM